MSNGILDFSIISRIRRNHALEHATMHVLASKHQGLVMMGVSGLHGFVLFADLPTQTICEAAMEGLERLQNGEAALAVHHNCGTNLAAPGLVAGMVAWVAMLGSGKKSKLKLHRLLLAALLAVLAFFLSKPLGPYLQQKVTTSAKPGSLEIFQVTTQKINGKSLHRILTRH